MTCFIGKTDEYLSYSRPLPQCGKADTCINQQVAVNFKLLENCVQVMHEIRNMEAVNTNSQSLSVLWIIAYIEYGVMKCHSPNSRPTPFARVPKHIFCIYLVSVVLHCIVLAYTIFLWSCNRLPAFTLVS